MGATRTVAEVCVIDRVKRKRCHTGEALKILGPTEITVVSNTLTPAAPAEENPVGSQHTVTATSLASQTGPISGAAILFSVAGANSASGTGTTDSSGRATFTYTGANTGGDTITACHDKNTNGVCETAELKATATKTWVRPTARRRSCSPRPARPTTWAKSTASRQRPRTPPAPRPRTSGRLLGQRRQHRRRHGDHERERRGAVLLHGYPGRRGHDLRVRRHGRQRCSERRRADGDGDQDLRDPRSRP